MGSGGGPASGWTGTALSGVSTVTLVAVGQLAALLPAPWLVFIAVLGGLLTLGIGAIEMSQRRARRLRKQAQAEPAPSPEPDVHRELPLGHGGNRIVRSSITDNGGPGVFIGAGATGNVIEDTFIARNGGPGVLFEGGPAEEDDPSEEGQ